MCDVVCLVCECTYIFRSRFCVSDLFAVYLCTVSFASMEILQLFLGHLSNQMTANNSNEPKKSESDNSSAAKLSGLRHISNPGKVSRLHPAVFDGPRRGDPRNSNSFILKPAGRRLISVRLSAFSSILVYYGGFGFCLARTSVI